MGNLAEIAKALVSPAEKLIDGMQKALGKAYEPRYLKRMADAQAYQLKKIGEAMRENSDIPIVYNKEGLSLSTTDYEEFVKRAQNRMAFQELRKQENIETVAGKALGLLEGKPEVEKESVDVDWLVEFFNSVENIGNEEMQDLWARLLAGEIQHSGTFSLRTMDRLSSISQNEAKTFERLLEKALCTHNNSFILSNRDFSSLEYAYNEIMLMNECGLIDSTPFLTTNVDVTFAFSAPILWSDNDVITARAKEGQKIIRLSIHPLTKVGKELSKIVGFNMLTQDIEKIADALGQRHNDVVFKVKKITEHHENSFSFEPDEEEIKEMEEKTKK